MAIETINVGTLPNDGTGDPMRVAFEKTNNNFAQLGPGGNGVGYTTLNTSTFGNLEQVIFSYDANVFTMGTLKIYSSASPGAESQCTEILAQRGQNGTQAAFAITGQSNIGDAIINEYNMDIANGNIQLSVLPNTEGLVNHYIVYQVLWNGTGITGTPIQLDGYTANTTLGTEDEIYEITTEQTVE